MGYKILHGGQEVEFTSKTRAGLNEEIERFIKEKRPRNLQAVSRDLVPEYYLRTVKGEEQGRWELRMAFR